MKLLLILSMMLFVACSKHDNFKNSPKPPCINSILVNNWQMDNRRITLSMNVFCEYKIWDNTSKEILEFGKYNEDSNLYLVSFKQEDQITGKTYNYRINSYNLILE